jgi:hypothetical protein
MKSPYFCPKTVKGTAIRLRQFVRALMVFLAAGFIFS